MKEYNRQTKKWEEPVPFPKAKARDLCKGKKEHDYVLVIPKYYRNNIHDVHTAEQVQKFYELKKQELVFEMKMEQEYRELGVRCSGFIHQPSKHFVCSICGKEKTEY